MNEAVIAVFIPIVAIVVTGLIFVTFFYFRSRERQLLIEKGLDAESIKEFFESKKDPFRMIKIGTVAIAFGLGLGLGMMLHDVTGKEYWTPFAIFFFTGIGFIAANLVTRKLQNRKTE
jgi:hypothetical protein